MRFLQALLISVNFHCWGILALSLAWNLRPPPEPRILTVELIPLARAPAPVDGPTPPTTPVQAGAREEERAAPAHEPTSPATETERRREPVVRARITRLPDPGPDSPKTVALWKIAAEDGEEPDSPPSHEPNLAPDRARRSPAPDQRTPARLLSGGDQRPLIEIIQARINAVTPVVHATAGACRFHQGTVQLQFTMRPDGYSAGKRILRSSGNACLDTQVATVLHLAEPYPYLAGWIPVTVRFTL